MDSISISKGLTFNSPLFGQDVYERLYVWCNGNNNSNIEYDVLMSGSFVGSNSSPWTITPVSGNIISILYNGNYTTTNTSTIFFEVFPIKVLSTNYDIEIGVKWINNDTNEVLKKSIMGIFPNQGGIYSTLLNLNALDMGINNTTPFQIRIEITTNQYVYWDNGYFNFRALGADLDIDTLVSNRIINIFNLFPEIKTIDFLSSFIKMFNISIIEDQENSNTLNFIPRSTFYNETIDYTKYIDIENYSIKPTNLYKNINFKHQTSKYKSNIDFKLGIGDREYGELKFNSNDIILKDEYKIETQFNIVPNRLITNTKIQTFYGFLNESEDNVDYGKLWKPNTEDFTIFYYNGSQQLKDIDNNNISLNFKIGDVGTTIIEDLNTYNKVSIVYSDDPDTYVNSLGYQVEVELSDNSFIFEKNLFSNYYSGEISRIYNQNSRLFEYECILPTREINRFSLDKLIIIGDRKFAIEQADINIKNGKTKLTLMNISPKTTSSIIYLTPPTIFTATLL